MVANGSDKKQDENRDRLLDEIRRRAEEAELKRIEEEDRSSGASPDHPHEDEAQSPFPTLPPPYPSSPSYEAERAQRGMVLRERLSIALDRRNLENARELYEELERFDPFDPALGGFRARLALVAEQPAEPTVKAAPAYVIPAAPSAPVPPAPVAPAAPLSPPETVTPSPVQPEPPEPFAFDAPIQAAPPPPEPIAPAASVEAPPFVEPPPAEPPAPSPVMEEVVQEDIATLYEEAVSLYEQEKYEQALHKLDRLLLKDRTNEDALALHQQVARAWDLAEVIKKEEARHRAAEPPPAPVQQPVIPRGGKDSDFWGPTELPEEHADGIVVPDTPAPVRKPQVPIADRVVARVSKVHVPVKPILIGLGGILVVVIGYMIVNAVLHAVVPPDRIICVYPPALTDGGADGQALADAFAEDLMLELGSVHAIHVVASPTALATRQRTTRPVRMAQSFGAGYVLLWNLSVRENVMSGSVTLMDTLHAQPVWQGKLDSPVQDLPRHRRELARKILQIMDVDISGTDVPLAQNAFASSGAGYQFYLQGRAALQSGHPDAVDLALTAFQQAVQGDSLDGDAWGALGWTYVLASEQVFTPAPTTVQAAFGSVERAMSLGARKAETFRTWGVAEMLNGNYAKAAVRLEEAVEASPSDAEALRRLALLHTLRGKTDDALQAATAAAEVDPLNPNSHLTVGLIHQFRGEFADAEASYRRAATEDRERPDAAELHAEVLVYLQRADDALANVTDIAARLRTDPAAYYRIGRIAQTGGKPKADWMNAFERARTLLEEELRARPDSALALSLYALTQTRLGAFRDAATAQQRALTLAPNDFRILYNAARMYALQRDKQQAMAYLTQAIDLRYDLRRILDMDLFNLRTDQEFLRSVTR